MKKSILSTLLILLIAGGAFAQEGVSFQVSAGGVYPLFDDLPFDYKAELGAQGSARIWYDLQENFSIGVEAHYMMLNYSDDSGNYLKSHYMGIPLLFKRQFENRLYVIAGIGYAGIISSSELAGWEEDEEGVVLPVAYSDIQGFVYLPASFGYQFDGGFFAEARSLWGLSKMSKVYDYKVTPLALSVGVRF